MTIEALICPDCGSPRVHQAVWYDHYEERPLFREDPPTSDSLFCTECDNHVDSLDHADVDGTVFSVTVHDETHTFEAFTAEQALAGVVALMGHRVFAQRIVEVKVVNQETLAVLIQGTRTLKVTL